jgi:trans-aconitate 2-methyltransferase
MILKGSDLMLKYHMTDTNNTGSTNMIKENGDSLQNGNSTIKFYDNFSTRQINAGINLRHKAILKGLKKAGLKNYDDVLEIGCGVGTLTQLIATNFKNSAIQAMDISPVNVELAKTRLKKFKNVTILAGDIIDAEITGLFDAIILPDVIEHIPIQQHNALFCKISGLLKDKGFIFINIPQPYYQEWNKVYYPEQLQIIDQIIYPGELIDNIEATGLYLVSLSTYSVWIKEFDYQQIVLRKIPQITEKAFNLIEQHVGLKKRIINSIKTRTKRK